MLTMELQRRARNGVLRRHLTQQPQGGQGVSAALASLPTVRREG